MHKLLIAAAAIFTRDASNSVRKGTHDLGVDQIPIKRLFQADNQPWQLAIAENDYDDHGVWLLQPTPTNGIRATLVGTFTQQAHRAACTARSITTQMLSKPHLHHIEPGFSPASCPQCTWNRVRITHDISCSYHI